MKKTKNKTPTFSLAISILCSTLLIFTCQNSSAVTTTNTKVTGTSPVESMSNIYEEDSQKISTKLCEKDDEIICESNINNDNDQMTENND